MPDEPAPVKSALGQSGSYTDSRWGEMDSKPSVPRVIDGDLDGMYHAITVFELAFTAVACSGGTKVVWPHASSRISVTDS